MTLGIVYNVQADLNDLSNSDFCFHVIKVYINMDLNIERFIFSAVLVMLYIRYSIE